MNVSRAAERLAARQPVWARQIAELERYVESACKHYPPYLNPLLVSHVCSAMRLCMESMCFGELVHRMRGRPNSIARKAAV